MEAKAAPLLGLLGGPRQFIIPLFQRTYSWREKHCQRLWDDVVRVGRDPGREGHFVGSVVYVERGLYTLSSRVPRVLVIDGQQRLTTITLLIAALRNAGAFPGIEGDQVTPEILTNYYLQNSAESGDLRHKLVLTQSDKDTLLRIVDRKPLPELKSRRVLENYKFFEERVASSGVDPAVIYRGLNKLLVVDIALSREHDNPQLIFESLNSTGLELSQADLIRNYVLMGLEQDLQDRLYDVYWRPIEARFGNGEAGGLFDRFMRDYLTVKTRTIPNIRDVYEEFKAYRAGGGGGKDVEALVADIARHARFFANMARESESDGDLRLRFRNINQLKVDVAYPLLLEMYGDYDEGRLAKADFVRALDLIESYVFRRAIVGIPTNSLNKTFAEFGRRIDKDHYLESFEARFQLLDGYRRFPNDVEFRAAFATKDVYSRFGRRHYLLRKLENASRTKEHVEVENYTIEHILPQNEDLSADWQGMLGPNWKEVQEEYLHTIGNLTLTGYNSQLSDRPFLEKRDMKGGFRDSPILLNEGLRGLTRWTEAEIVARGEQLADLAVRVWAVPGLAPAVVEQYRHGHATGGTPAHDIDHFPGLTGAVRDLFDTLRARVEAFGPDVEMSVTKHYIPFRTTTKGNGNFVAAKPQSSRLRLYLNIPYDKLHDPRHIAQDKRKRGRLASGATIVRWANPADADYVLGLVRQSYEWITKGAVAAGAVAVTP